jgi:peptidoglycan/LPS O-acetylase OafA/YrhL
MMNAHIAADHTKYRPDIDGLRALAVILVVVHHAFPTLAPGGFVGVDVFFVISGYLISGIILDDLRQGRFSYKTFYQRRIRRIFPALIVVLACCLAAGVFLLRADQFIQLGGHTAASAAFLANYSMWSDAGYFMDEAKSNILLHLWSLAVEEQFYIIWPIFLVIAVISRRFFIAAFGIIFAASMALSIVYAKDDPSRAFYWLPPRMWELMVGAALAYVTARRTASWRWSAYRTIIGLCLIVIASCFFNASINFPGYYALVPTLGAALVLSASPLALPNRLFLSNWLAVSIGLISYPLYLWHWPLLAFAKATAAPDSRLLRLLLVFLAIAAAILTYRGVERPIRFKRKTHAAALAFPLAVLGGLGYLIQVADGFPGRTVASTPDNKFLQYYADMHRHIGGTYLLACDFYDNDLKVARATIPSSCLPGGNNKAWLVWGDSHAQALGYGIRSILPSGFDYAQITTSGCSPSLDPEKNRGLLGSCTSNNRLAISTLRRSPPDVLFLAQRFEHEETDWTAIAKFAHSAGVRKVVLIGPAPQWLPSLPSIIVKNALGTEVTYVSVGLDPTVIETDSILQRRYGQSDELTYVSLIDLLCQPEGCMARLEAPGPMNLTAFDYGHLTPDASTYVARRLIVNRL